jgi:hypothetical protein
MCNSNTPKFLNLVIPHSYETRVPRLSSSLAQCYTIRELIPNVNHVLFFNNTDMACSSLIAADRTE